MRLGHHRAHEEMLCFSGFDLYDLALHCTALSVSQPQLTTLKHDKIKIHMNCFAHPVNNTSYIILFNSKLFTVCLPPVLYLSQPIPDFSKLFTACPLSRRQSIRTSNSRFLVVKATASLPTRALEHRSRYVVQKCHKGRVGNVVRKG
jgi:hypothetical protein